MCTILLSCAYQVQSADIFYALGSEFDFSEGSEAILEIFEARGDEVQLWDNTLLQDDPDAALDAADDADLVFLDESISSGRADALIETTTPVINNEQFAFDNWGMTDINVGHGSPQRPRNDAELDAGSSFGTTISIVDPPHPIAARAGVSGDVQVYDDTGGRIDWGRPGDSADLVALLPGFEEFQPASPIFVYEAGAELLDGSTAAGMRIGFFISDTNRGPEPDDPEIEDDATDNSGEAKEGTLLTDAGISLLNATIDYALGIANTPGDFNGDGVLDLNDINLLSTESASGQNNTAFDLNGDGTVNGADVSTWIKDIRVSWIGDANADGEFNSGDFVQVFTAGKFELEVDANWGDGDWNGDGRFNSGDFVAAFTDGGFELGPRENANSVPEPSSLILMVTSILLVVPRRRS